MVGEIYSSVMYRIFMDGSARNIRINAGIEVQKYSISWFSLKKRFENEFISKIIIIIKIIIVIIVITIKL